MHLRELFMKKNKNENGPVAAKPKRPPKITQMNFSEEKAKKYLTDAAETLKKEGSITEIPRFSWGRGWHDFLIHPYFLGNSLGVPDSFCGFFINRNTVSFKLWDKNEYAKERITFLKEKSFDEDLCIAYDKHKYNECKLIDFSDWGNLEKSYFCDLNLNFDEKNIKEKLKKIISIFTDFCNWTKKLETPKICGETKSTFDENVEKSLNKDPLGVILKEFCCSTKAKEHRTANINRIIRNPNVVAVALRLAKGVCQGCNQKGPFVRRGNFIDSDCTLYLEVHHIIPLSDGGEDKLDNVCALCPNCHKLLHFGRQNDKDDMIRKIRNRKRCDERTISMIVQYAEDKEITIEKFIKILTKKKLTKEIYDLCKSCQADEFYEELEFLLEKKGCNHLLQ